LLKIPEEKESLNRLRINSRVKHEILKDYLSTWFSILGTWNSVLNYFDCFAGGGKYIWNRNKKIVEGSPVISVKVCINLLNSNKKTDRIR